MPVKINVTAPENLQVNLLGDAVLELNDMLERVGTAPAVLISKDGILCTHTDEGELVDLTVDSFAALIRVMAVPGKEVGEEGKWVELAAVPRALVRAYMDKQDFKGIPRIKQVARAPIVRPDFTIRWEPGWDSATRCWVKKGLTKDTGYLDAKIARADGSEEWFDIRDVFRSFPFLDQKLCADALAAAFTPLLSSAINGPLPGLIVSARKPGSGKTELTKFCSILGNGGKTFTTWRGATELEKTIGTYVAEDNRVVIFDNIKNDIDNKDMESVITSRSVSFRKMYSHRSVSLRSNTSWFMTANGAIVSEDMVRRCIVIMLDKENCKGLSEWSDSIPEWVEANEAKMVTYMCDMIEKWRDAGCVPGKVFFSNFSEWSRVVSGILETAGIGGMWEARDEVVAAAIQTEDEDEIPVVEAIAAVMGGADWKAGELWEKVNDYTDMGFADGKVMLVREWLKSVGKVKAGTKPGIQTGRALHYLVGKSFPGCDVVLTCVTKGKQKIYTVKGADGSELPPAGFMGVPKTKF